jgi:hypothetical protein
MRNEALRRNVHDEPKADIREAARAEAQVQACGRRVLPLGKFSPPFRPKCLIDCDKLPFLIVGAPRPHLWCGDLIPLFKIAAKIIKA